MTFKTIWSSTDWGLQSNDNDEFRIMDLMTNDSITISLDDKDQFRDLIEVLSRNLDDEVVENDYEVTELEEVEGEND